MADSSSMPPLSMEDDDDVIPESYCGPGQWATSENMDLYEAALKGDISGLRDALARGANPNFFHKTEEGKPSPLHAVASASAVAGGEDKAVAEAGSGGEGGGGAVSETDAVECTKALLEGGARLSAMMISNRNTPLHQAASSGSEEVVRVLLDASERTSSKCTPSTENAFGNTPLHAAVRSGSVEVVRLLLERGSDVNAANHRGSTPLHVCAFLAVPNEEGGDYDSSSRSTSSASSKEETGGTEGRPSNLLTRRGSRIVDPQLQISAMLLSSGSVSSQTNPNDGIDVNRGDANGYTPLHVAAQRGCVDMAELLVDSGASLSAKTAIDPHTGRGGRTPAAMATFGGKSATKKKLEEWATAIANGGNGKDGEGDSSGEKGGGFVVTGKLARDYESGYRLSRPAAGAGVRAVRTISPTE